jgi:hypothetical protein
MIIDKLLEFGDAANCFAGLGLTVVVGDVIDLGAAPTLQNIGGGEPLYLVIGVDTTVVGATSTTEFRLVSDSAAALTTSPTTHFSSGALPVATLVAGYQVCAIPIPSSGTYERYLGVTAVNAVAATTAGKVNAFLALTPPAWAALPDAVA